MQPIDTFALQQASQVLVAYKALDILGFLLFGFFLVVIFAATLSKIYPKKKSSEYHREVMTDLYVVGMIRKYAKEDGIDLMEEMKELKHMSAVYQTKDKNLDKVIEQTLKERIVSDSQKNTEHKK